MQWPRAGVTSRRRTPHCRHSRARCSFLSPSPLGGRGKGEGGRWRHLEPLGTSPLSLRLRLRSAQGGALILSPGGGEESGKEGARLLFVISARGTDRTAACPTSGSAIRGGATRAPAAMQWPGARGESRITLRVAAESASQQGTRGNGAPRCCGKDDTVAIMCKPQ